MDVSEVDLKEIVYGARDALTVQRVYGEPFTQDGVTVIPVAKVRGGSGGGTGEAEGKNVGGGTGFGLSARPVGAYVITDGRVEWQPALDLNRIIIGGQIVAVAGFVIYRSWMKRRFRYKRFKLKKRS